MRGGGILRRQGTTVELRVAPKVISEMPRLSRLGRCFEWGGLKGDDGKSLGGLD